MEFWEVSEFVTRRSRIAEAYTSWGSRLAWTGSCPTLGFAIPLTVLVRGFSFLEAVSLFFVLVTLKLKKTR